MFKSLTPTLSIIVSIVLFVFFTSPQYAHIKEIKSEIAEYESTIAGYKDFNTRLDDLILAKNAVNIDDLERIDRMIPDIADTTQTLVDLKAMADASGLLLGNVVTETEDVAITNGGNDEEISSSESLVVSTISFEIIGTYEQFKSFMQMVEGSLTLMEITLVSLGVSSDIFQQYSMTVQTYSLSE